MKNLALCLFLITMVGCGSGGGDVQTQTLTPLGTAVSMSAVKNVFLGLSSGAGFNFPTLVGSDTQGRAWSGSYNMVANGATVFENQKVTKSSVLVTLRVDGGTPVSVVTTKYFHVADGSSYKSVSSSGTIYIPVSQALLPNNPRIGDFGAIGSFTGNDGTATTVTWALAADYQGASILTFSSIIKTGGTVTGTEADSYYLDSTGIPTKIVISTTISGTTVTISGNKS